MPMIPCRFDDAMLIHAVHVYLHLTCCGSLPPDGLFMIILATNLIVLLYV
jgi:hypothetical protein